ncbi:hypothetical protein DFH06DRAFT_1002041, partial [Mycena polygramma]
MEKQAEIDKDSKPATHAFLIGHPLFRSHAVSCDFRKMKTVIPNFIGGAMPRADKGDRSYYCQAILTLFKPWRSPGDLKDALSTWEQTFDEHEFSSRQKQLIQNFNVRYECNDARDDHFNTLKRKIAEAKIGQVGVFPQRFMGEVNEFAEDLSELDYDSEDHDCDGQEDEQKGSRTLRILGEQREMRRIMQSSGWLNACLDSVPQINTDRYIPPQRSRMDWSKLV